jgi:hypothetical protein
MERSYRYEFEPGNHTVYYYEIRGLGPPPNDIGYPGDVYIDMTPGSPAIYAMGNDEWTIWHGHIKHLVGPRGRYEPLGFPHPLLRDRFLWCSDKSVVWYSRDSIRKDPRFSKDGVLASCLIPKVMGYAGAEPSSLGKRSREDETDGGVAQEDEETETVERIVVGKKARLDKRVDVYGEQKSICSNRHIQIIVVGSRT